MRTEFTATHRPDTARLSRVRPFTALALISAASGLLPGPLASAAQPSAQSTESRGQDLQLWYTNPAKDWQSEALPIGNGRLGAMIFGGVPQEHIQFNEQSLWIGDEHDTGAYQAFGDVFVTLEQGDATHYRRELDISRAVHTVTYESGGVRFRREAFASYPAQIMVFHFTADHPGALTGSVTLTDMHHGTITAAGNELGSTGSLAGYVYSEGSTPGRKTPYQIALSYEARVRVLHQGGAIQAGDGKITFQKASSITLLLDAGTDFLQDASKSWVGPAPHSAIEARLDSAARTPYSRLLAQHVQDYQALFNRVALNLGSAPESSTAAPTDLRLAAYKQGAVDPELEVLLFQYGRYLLISSSREGTLPANLQGKWNDSNNPPWRCDYHTDINVQMNYWPAGPANLNDCFSPFAEWLNSIRTVREAETRAQFHVRGWTMHGENGLFGGSTWAWVLPSSAWCAQNLWDHYAFTGDRAYLRTLAYPMMKEICEFWIDSLKTLPDGTLVSPSGFSPEHSPSHGSSTEGVSFDQELVWDLFTNTMEASDVLGVDRNFRNLIAEKRAKLLTPRIGHWGQLQEWMQDLDDPNDHHRHLSHLVGLYPGRQISPFTSPKLAAAARVSLTARGDGGTGWSKTWKISLWARLLDGNHAHLIASEWIRQSVLPNLFDTCPPFQIDGNFGYAAGICEMLLQSQIGDPEHGYEIDLLPALPQAWAISGSVHGLRARGGCIVDIAWKNGKITSYRITSPEPETVRVRINGELKTMRTVKAKG